MEGLFGGNLTLVIVGVLVLILIALMYYKKKSGKVIEGGDTSNYDEIEEDYEIEGMEEYLGDDEDIVETEEYKGEISYEELREFGKKSNKPKPTVTTETPHQKIVKDSPILTKINKPFENNIDFNTLVDVLDGMNTVYNFIIFSNDTSTDLFLPVQVNTTDIMDIVGVDMYSGETRIENIHELLGLKVTSLPYNGNRTKFGGDSITYVGIHEQMVEEEYFNSMMVAYEKIRQSVADVINLKKNNKSLVWDDMFDTQSDSYVGSHISYLIMSIINKVHLRGAGNIHDTEDIKKRVQVKYNIPHHIPLMIAITPVTDPNKIKIPAVDGYMYEEYLEKWYATYTILLSDIARIRDYIHNIEEIWYNQEYEFNEKITYIEKVIGREIPYTLTREEVESEVKSEIQNSIYNVKLHKLRLAVAEGTRNPSEWNLF